MYIREVLTWKSVNKGSLNLEKCTYRKFQLGKVYVKEVSTWKSVRKGSFKLRMCSVYIREVATYTSVNLEGFLEITHIRSQNLERVHL